MQDAVAGDAAAEDATEGAAAEDTPVDTSEVLCFDFSSAGNSRKAKKPKKRLTGRSSAKKGQVGG